MKQWNQYFIIALQKMSAKEAAEEANQAHRIFLQKKKQKIKNKALAFLIEELPKFGINFDLKLKAIKIWSAWNQEVGENQLIDKIRKITFWDHDKTKRFMNKCLILNKLKLKYLLADNEISTSKN